MLKDITKIRNITKDIVSSCGENPKSNFLRDVSMNSIRDSDQDVKRNNLEENSDQSVLYSGKPKGRKGYRD